MSRLKKGADGRYSRGFRLNGKYYNVKARTPEELTRKETELRERIEKGLDRRKSPTLDEYHETWNNNRVDIVKESTLRCQIFQYNNCANVIISTTGKRLGDMKLKEIMPDDIREVQAALKENHKSQGVNDNINVLSHVFADAVRERVIDYNPCSPVHSLKCREEKGRDTIHRALTDSEVNTFLEAAQDSFYFDCFRIMLFTGMRVGEVGALYISDIKDGEIHVERTITKTSTGGYMIGESAKTAAGRRTIPLNGTIKEIIEHQKAINKMLDGDKVVSFTDTIFKAPERGLLKSTPLNREIGRICKKAGIQHFTSHAFRSTFCTRMIASGAPFKAVQEIMGHTDVKITLGLYGHARQEDKIEAMSRIG